MNYAKDADYVLAYAQKMSWKFPTKLIPWVIFLRIRHAPKIASSVRHAASCALMWR